MDSLQVMDDRGRLLSRRHTFLATKGKSRVRESRLHDGWHRYAPAGPAGDCMRGSHGSFWSEPLHDGAAVRADDRGACF